MRLISLFVILLVPISILGQQAMSLDDCIDYALNHHPQIQQAKINTEKSQNTLSQSKKSFLPTISTGFSQGLNSGRSIDPFTNDFVQRTISSNSYSVGASIALFNGFANKYTIELNEQTLTTSKLEIDRLKIELRNQVVIAYMNVLLAQEYEKLSLENLAMLELESERVIALVDEGRLPNADLIDMKAQKASLEYEMTVAGQTIRSALLSLARLMYFPDFSRLTIEPLKDASTEILLSKAKNAESKQMGINKLPAFKIGYQGLRNANIALKLAQTDKMPTVSLNAGLGTGFSSVGASETPYFNQIGRNFNQFGRLSVNFPIFTNGQVKFKTQAARLDKLLAESQINQNKIQLSQEIDELYMLIEAAQEKNKSAIIQLEAQNASLTAAKERFFEGLINSIELNTVQQAVNKANSDYILSKYELYFRRLVLEGY